MEQTNFGYGLDQPVSGRSVVDYLSDLIEKNDNQQIEIERGKLSNALINARTKYSRACMDAASLNAKLARERANEADLKARLAEAELQVEKLKAQA